jgi:Rod binding domain-containing protein
MRIGLEEENTSRESQTGAVSPRLINAAHEFEAQMMKELLKPMTGLDGFCGEAEDAGEGTGSGGALGQFASEALAQAISRQGGFGIADRIIHELSRSGHNSVSGNISATATGNLK